MSEKSQLIPSNSDHRLILWDLTGGLRAPLPDDFEPLPTLQIFADGRVISGSNSPEIENGEMKLDDEALLKLMRFVVDEQRYFETSQEDLRRQLEDHRPALADGLTSEFEVETASNQQSISIYALRMTARAYPDYQPLQRLANIEQRFRELKLIAGAGGPTAIQELLKSVNDQLKDSDPTVAPLSTESLTSAVRYKDGRMMVRFYRKDAENPVSATISRLKVDGPTQVEVKVGR